MQVKIEAGWQKVLQPEFEKPYFTELIGFVKSEYNTTRIYPPGSQIFAAFDACAFEKTRVVIIGQDPYHGKGQANGLCFSVNKGIPIPPSLVNIFKELNQDVGKPFPNNGDLSDWASQGVLLLNATLTVRASQPGSHQNKGWENFTDAVIDTLSMQKENLVFLLWGAYAQKKGDIIDSSKHLILSSPHPSPFSANRGFFGNKHFSKCNNYLSQVGYSPIDW